MILLDTNIVVAYLNGNTVIGQRIVDQLSKVGIPSLVAAELYYGAYASSRIEENLAKLERLFQVVPNYQRITLFSKWVLFTCLVPFLVYFRI